ncbi:hypothetical protein PMAYCL1PPCAC_16007, partial [Pristionchus mayeri]
LEDLSRIAHIEWFSASSLIITDDLIAPFVMMRLERMNTGGTWHVQVEQPITADTFAERLTPDFEYSRELLPPDV